MRLVGDNRHDALAALRKFLHDLRVSLVRHAHRNPAEVAFRNGQLVEGVERELAHLAQQRMHRDGNHVQAARSQRTVRLVVIALDVARE